MLTPQSQLHTVLILFVLAAAIIDWRTHRIPNLLCAAAAIIGLTYQMWMHGEDGLLAALGGVAVGFAMFLPFYVVRAFGAGDVKAMATVGTFLGIQATLLAVGMTLIAGAVLGVAVLLLRRASASAPLGRLMGLLTTPIASMQASRNETEEGIRQRVPYGIAIACGTTAALLIVTH
jgi:prepilin peptidase CpaA